MIDRREDTADELAHDRDERRAEAADEDYRQDDDQELDEDTDFHSSLGYLPHC